MEAHSRCIGWPGPASQVGDLVKVEHLPGLQCPLFRKCLGWEIIQSVKLVAQMRGPEPKYKAGYGGTAETGGALEFDDQPV